MGVTVLRHVDEPLSSMIHFTMPSLAYGPIATVLADAPIASTGGQVALVLGLDGNWRRQGSGHSIAVWLRRSETEFLAVTIEDILDGDQRVVLTALPGKTVRSRTRRALRDALEAIERALT